MAQYVELPDGSYAEFPDDTPDDQIAKALGGVTAPAAPTPEEVRRTKVEEAKAATAEKAKDNPLYAAGTGLMHSLKKTSRGIGTLVLPEAAERWAESKGMLPTAEDVEILGAGRGSGMAGNTAGIVADVATDLLPARKIMGTMGAAKNLPQALAKAGGTGGILGFLRSEKGQEGEETTMGAAGGALGEAGGRVLARTLAGPVGRAAGYLALKGQGVRQTLGQAAGPGMVGNAIRTGESFLQEMPVGGYTMRQGVRRASEDLTDAAARTAAGTRGVTPVAGMPSRAALVQQMENASNAAMNAADKVKVPLTKSAAASITNKVDDVASQHKLSTEEAAQLHEVVNRYIMGRKAPNARTIESGFVKDALDGFETLAQSENPRLAKAALEMKREMRGALDTMLAMKGTDTAALRQSRMDINALRRAPKGPTQKGVSGEDLQRGITANADRYGVGASDPMRELAENASNIGYAVDPRRSVISRVLSPTLEGGSAAATGGATTAAALGAGKLLSNQRVVNALINDPVLEKKLLEQLRKYAVGTGAGLAAGAGE